MTLHSSATFWFVLLSLLMFLVIPELLKRGLGLWPSLVAACLLTVSLHSLMLWLGPKSGLRL